MTFPSLELKYNKETKNVNTINNNIVIRGIQDVSEAIRELSPPPPIAISPDNIKQFKEALMSILISYFKNNIVLLNNLVELSDKIITKIDDLQTLLSLLLNVPVSDIFIEVEEISVKNCCGEICKKLPRYRKINEILINKKQSFKISYNQYYVQLQTEFNISLEYVLL
jgi:hypothetical protein